MLYLLNALRSYKDKPVIVLTKGRHQGGLIPILVSPEISSLLQSPIRLLAPRRNLSGSDLPVLTSAPVFWPRPVLGGQGRPSAERLPFEARVSLNQRFWAWPQLTLAVPLSEAGFSRDLFEPLQTSIQISVQT